MDVSALVKQVFMEVAKVDSLSLDGDCRLDSLDLDSLALLEIIYELEERLNASLDDLQLQQLQTMADFIHAVAEQAKSVA